MPHALFPVNPVTVFIGIFLLSIILYTLKELVKYAQVFWSKRTQQTNLAISKNTPSTMSPTEGGESPHVIFRPVGPVSPKTATDKSKSSRGDSISVSGTNGPSSSSTSIHIKNNNPQADRPDYCGTQDQNSQTHLCKEIPENCYGSSTGRGARDIPNFRRDNEHNRLYESSTSGSYQGRSESQAHQGTGKAAPCLTDKSDSTNIRCQQTKSRATQIYLKKREVGTHPPYVLDSEDSDKIIFNFMQSVVQQAQQHMFQQLEQCMQQAYTGLTLGMPVRAKEYSEQFKKNNNTLVLTETKWKDVDNHPSQWEDDEDSASGNAQSPPSLPLPSPNPEATNPKEIQPSTSGFGGARHKTALPTRAICSTAVISGHPAGSETDGEYEDYFNPCIFTRSRLITTNPAFAAAVSLHRPSVPHPIETVHRCPWDGHLHGRNTRSQEALRRQAEKKVAKRYPYFKD